MTQGWSINFKHLKHLKQHILYSTNSLGLFLPKLYKHLQGNQELPVTLKKVMEMTMTLKPLEKKIKNTQIGDYKMTQSFVDI